MGNEGFFEDEPIGVCSIGDGDGFALDVDGVAGDTDDALDIKLARLRRGSEDDHITSCWLAKSV